MNLKYFNSLSQAGITKQDIDLYNETLNNTEEKKDKFWYYIFPTLTIGGSFWLSVLKYKDVFSFVFSVLGYLVPCGLISALITLALSNIIIDSLTRTTNKKLAQIKKTFDETESKVRTEIRRSETIMYDYACAMAKGSDGLLRRKSHLKNTKEEITEAYKNYFTLKKEIGIINLDTQPDQNYYLIYSHIEDFVEDGIVEKVGKIKGADNDMYFEHISPLMLSPQSLVSSRVTCIV